MDGDAVRRLVDQDRLPCFARLIDAGLSGDMAPGAPSPMAAWGSAATGLPAHRHGLAAPMTVRPDRMGIAPAGTHDWCAAPFWRTLAKAGRTVALINLPGTIPAARAGAAAVVDPRFFAAPQPGDGEWPLPPSCVHPPAWRDRLRPARVHPDELAVHDTGGLPPAALAEAGAIQAVALDLLRDDPPDVLVLACPIAARAPGEAALRFLDLALDTLLRAAGPAAELLLVAPDGFVLATGAGFAPDTLAHGIRPEDIAATVLARHGLPVPGGRPLDGSTPPAASPLPPPVPAWRDQPAAPGVRTAERARGFVLARAAMAEGDHAYAAEQLAALAVAAPDDPDLLLLLGQCQFYLGDWASCHATGVALARVAPDQPWGAMMQGASLLMADRREEAAPLLAHAAVQGAVDPAALCRLGALALHAGDAAAARGHYAAAVTLAPADADALAGLGLALLAAGDLAAGERYLRASLRRRFHAPALHHQLALLYEHADRWEEAAASLATARRQAPDTPGLAALTARLQARVPPAG